MAKNKTMSMMLMVLKKSIPFIIIASFIIFVVGWLLNSVIGAFPKFGMLLTGIVVLMLFVWASITRPGEESLSVTFLLGLTYLIGISIVMLFGVETSKYMIDFAVYDGLWKLLPWAFLVSAWYLSDVWTSIMFKKFGWRL